MSERSSILVTGGAGFIGSQVVQDLLEQEQMAVVTLDRLTYAGHRSSLAACLLHPHHTFVQGDINDADLLRHLFQTHQPRAVIHLAAESHVDRSIDGAADFIQTNVCGTYQLLEATRDYVAGMSASSRERFRFLHVSTDEVHGSLGPDDAAFSESTNYAPRSPYAATKAASDHLVRAWHHTYGLPTIVTNCSNNYGPRQYPEKLIPLALVKMLRDEPIPLYGDGSQIRDWLHVTDHSRALRLIMQAGIAGQTYVIGSGVETSNRQLLDLLCGWMDELQPRSDGHSYCSKIVSVRDRPGHDARYAIDARHIEKTLGWQPSVSLHDGLRSTVMWYLENRQWWEEILVTTNATSRRG